MKNILFISTRHKLERPLLELLRELENRSFCLHVFSSNKDILDFFSNPSSSGTTKKIRPGFNFDSKVKKIGTVFLLPLICLKQFISLVYIKALKGLDIVICVNNRERLVFTPVASLLKIKVIWIERPDVRHDRKRKLLSRSLRSMFRSVDRVLVFNQESFNRLKEKGFAEEKIKNIHLGASLNREHQDDLFSNLAKKRSSRSFFDCFSVGIVADFNNTYQIENLFQSIRICLEVFDNLRVIIIGEGKEKKRLSWLARQNNIENLVYLVGEQSELEKWWESFDVYLSWAKSPGLKDFQIGLEAMLAELPVIAHKDKGWEDLVKEGQTGFLVSEGDSEDLAQKLIHLQQKPHLKKKMGREASELVKNNFTFSKQVERLLKEL